MFLLIPDLQNLLLLKTTSEEGKGDKNDTPSTEPPILERSDLDLLTQRMNALQAKGVPKPIRGPPLSEELGS